MGCLTKVRKREGEQKNSKTFQEYLRGSFLFKLVSFLLIFKTATEMVLLKKMLFFLSFFHFHLKKFVMIFLKNLLKILHNKFVFRELTGFWPVKLPQQ